jgi:hypothetical protein
VAETDGSGWVEEAVGQHADVKCAGRIRQQHTKASTISDHARERLELSGGIIQRSADPCRSRTRKARSELALIEIAQYVIHLPEASLCLDLGAEARAA